MDALVFSALVGAVASAALVGTVLFFVGGCRALGRAGLSPWLFLVPVYGLYLLFRTARCLVLFGVELLCLGAVALCWSLPTGFLQEFWVVAAVLAWVVYGWCAAALCERLHAPVSWQAAAFAFGPYVLAAAAFGEGPFDPWTVPAVTAPFQGLEARLWSRDPTAALGAPRPSSPEPAAPGASAPPPAPRPQKADVPEKGAA